MTKEEKLKQTEETLEWMKKGCPELEKLFVYPGDARLGGVVALARQLDHGVVDPVTAFMSCAEMKQFLNGYWYKSENRIKAA